MGELTVPDRDKLAPHPALLQVPRARCHPLLGCGTKLFLYRLLAVHEAFRRFSEER